MLNGPDRSLVIFAGQADEPGHVRLIAFSPHVGPEDTGSGESLVLLFEVPVREQLDELAEGALAEFGLHAVGPGPDVGSVGRCRVLGESAQLEHIIGKVERHAGRDPVDQQRWFEDHEQVRELCDLIDRRLDDYFGSRIDRDAWPEMPAPGGGEPELPSMEIDVGPDLW